MALVNKPVGAETQNGLAPVNGPKYVTVALTLAEAEQIIDLTLQIQSNAIDFIQSVWIDNLDNANALELYLPISQHRINVPAGVQGYYAYIGDEPKPVVRTSEGEGTVTLIFLNVPMAMIALGDNTPGNTPIPSTSAAAITSVNSLATSQQLLAANANRQGLIVINTDANALYLKYGATASLVGGGYTVIIPQNGYWEMPWPIYTGVIDGIWVANGAGLAELTET